MIDNDKAKKLLTPSAQTVLNELVEQYKRELLDKALENATDNSGTIYEIAVKDIINAKNDEKTQLLKKNTKKQIFVNLIISISLLYSVIGLAYFLFIQYGVKFDTNEKYGLIIFITGIFIYIFSNLIGNLNSYRLQKKSNSDVDEMKFIKKWQELEVTTRNWLSNTKGESLSNISIKEIINIISIDFINDKNEIDMLNNSLQLRNKILHNDIKVPKSELSNYIVFLDKTINKINKNI
jgi:hypothetical protein